MSLIGEFSGKKRQPVRVWGNCHKDAQQAGCNVATSFIPLLLSVDSEGEENDVGERDIT